MSKVKPFVCLVNAKGCMICESHLGTDGYPKIKRDHRRMPLSRLIYELNYGPLPDGVVMRHKCDNPGCINPLHLEPGTHADNVADRVDRGRSAIGEKNGRAKLTEDDVRYVLSRPNFTDQNLADGLGVDRGTIRAIRKGKTWQHIAP